jgi:hypothetical protein
MRLLIFAYEVNTSEEFRSAFVEVMTAVLINLTIFPEGRTTCYRTGCAQYVTIAFSMFRLLYKL